MVGSGESSGDESIDPVAERTQRMAENYAHDIELETRKWLSDVKIDFGVEDDIIAQKRQIAIEKFKATREAGQMNDTGSVAPGVILYLRLPRFEDHYRQTLSFDQVYDRAGELDMAFDLYSIAPGKSSEVGDWYRWRLPEAGYQTWEGLDRIDIRIQPEYDQWGDLTTDRGCVILCTDNVVRIEGFNGELWQHPRYHLPTDSDEATPAS